MSSDGGEDTDRTESDSQQNRWPSILSLLGGSRQQTEKPEETGKIDEELAWANTLIHKPNMSGSDEGGICNPLWPFVLPSHGCLSLHLDNQSDCPICRSALNKTNIFPNFQYLKSVFETALSQRQRIERDETRIKQELLVAFLEKLEKKNQTVIGFVEV
ncbi:hypothetical protein BD408DRAFT_403108 [Parasitella parasitica]|nr:hypothetical protein BD408DRAFT_403108 [Parasitella parasitica]